MADEQEYTHNKEQLGSIKLVKNTKGYNWEIKIYAEDPTKIPATLKVLNKDLETSFGKKDE